MPVLNRIRLKCSDGDRASLHIKSTLDNTYKLDHKTDECISFTDNDLIAIKNVRESPCTITLEAVRLPDGRRAVLAPSRSAHFTLQDPEVSQVHSVATYRLGGGETCMLRSDQWAGKLTGGAVFPV